MPYLKRHDPAWSEEWGMDELGEGAVEGQPVARYRRRRCRSRSRRGRGIGGISYFSGVIIAVTVGLGDGR